MAFDSVERCTTEEVFNLPVCLKDDPDGTLLHTAIADVTEWMYAHHIPKDAYDPPYVYRRDYMPEWVSANDVAALSRIAMAAHVRGIALPLVLEPLLPAQQGEQVAADDVTYVAAEAGAIAAALPDLLAAMQAADGGSTGDEKLWVVLAAIFAGAAALGVLAAIVGEWKYEEPKRAAT